MTTFWIGFLSSLAGGLLALLLWRWISLERRRARHRRVIGWPSGETVESHDAHATRE